MKILFFLAFLGIVIADNIPTTNYGVPNESTLPEPNGNEEGAAIEPIGNGHTTQDHGNGDNPVDFNVHVGSTATTSKDRNATQDNGFINGPESNGDGFIATNGVLQNGNGAVPSNVNEVLPNGYGVDPQTAALHENIPGSGVPGKDYPVLASVPDTGFSCDAQNVPGYYADSAPEVECQVFHVCQDRPDGRRQQDSFLCPNGTVFNQQYLVCDWWFNFDCATAEDFYSVNELLDEVINVVYNYANGNGNGNNDKDTDGHITSGNGNGNGPSGYSANNNVNENGSNNDIENSDDGNNGGGSEQDQENGNESDSYGSHGNEARNSITNEDNGDETNDSVSNSDGSKEAGVTSTENGESAVPSYSYSVPL
ncbi:putative uncharacterized protein DDB_G0286901 [Macrobrachium nipponense]|uniref:putative uncharacterized protein DDB_G0286901 n=1 Tax=Macrobrachium nipponense TaxID=159736 RepID=UPI0030C7FE32